MKLFAKIVTCPYLLVLWLRNTCYDWGLMRSVTPDVQTISIGNITVGGTGKTPHTELVLRLLSHRMPLAVLSRGYKRTTKGFRYVNPNDSASDAGDEPLQIKRKFPSVVVAVCANRIAAIKQIAKDYPHIKLVVLDDSFQYRKLKPTYSILLSDYHRPYTQDLLLPFGRLRDLPSQASRADMVIVTKSPRSLSPANREVQQQALCPKPHQQWLFTTFVCGAPSPLFGEELLPCAANEIIALTGIAQPKPFLQEVSKLGSVVQHLQFGDHHRFSQRESARINATVAQYPHAVIYTTEKDAMRLLEAKNLSQETKAALYYIPIQAEFCTAEEGDQFFRILQQKGAINFSISYNTGG